MSIKETVHKILKYLRGEEEKEEKKKRRNTDSAHPSELTSHDNHPGFKLPSYFTTNLATHQSSTAISDSFNGFLLAPPTTYLDTGAVREHDLYNLARYYTPTKDRIYQTKLQHFQSTDPVYRPLILIKKNEKDVKDIASLYNNHKEDTENHIKKEQRENETHSKTANEELPRPNFVTTTITVLPVTEESTTKNVMRVKDIENTIAWRDNKGYREYEKLSALIDETIDFLKTETEKITSSEPIQHDPKLINVNIWNNFGHKSTQKL